MLCGIRDTCPVSRPGCGPGTPIAVSSALRLLLRVFLAAGSPLCSVKEAVCGLCRLAGLSCVVFPAVSATLSRGDSLLLSTFVLCVVPAEPVNAAGSCGLL